MKIALFGGSFDPPHFGHQKVADYVVTQGIADQVWFVPCADHPFNKQISSIQHRMWMLRHAVSHPICTYEVNKTGKSYSYETLRYFSSLFRNCSFCWIIGSDQLVKFTGWYQYQELLRNYPVLVYPREGFTLISDLPNMIMLTKAPTINISSSQIRASAYNNKKLHIWVSPAIIGYIKKHQLYEGAS